MLVMQWNTTSTRLWGLFTGMSHSIWIGCVSSRARHNQENRVLDILFPSSEIRLNEEIFYISFFPVSERVAIGCLFIRLQKRNVFSLTFLLRYVMHLAERPAENM